MADVTVTSRYNHAQRFSGAMVSMTNE